jgi:DNA invertase Pin-like site-specific DNA recombinase
MAEPRLIGYARCSTRDQNPQMQIDALKEAGCSRLFIEQASGGDRDRPQLAASLDYAQKGDVFVVWKIDRAARSLHHLIEIVDKLGKKGVAFKSLKDAGLDTTTAAGMLMFQIVGAFAEFERSVIKERTMAGLAAARREGRVGGRKRKLDRNDFEALQDAVRNRDPAESVADVARKFGVNRATFYRYRPMDGAT